LPLGVEISHLEGKKEGGGHALMGRNLVVPLPWKERANGRGKKLLE